MEFLYPHSFRMVLITYSEKNQQMTMSRLWDVKLSIRLMGRSCKNCTQDYIASVAAISSEDAVAKVKEMSGADPDTHKFLVAYVRERK